MVELATGAVMSMALTKLAAAARETKTLVNMVKCVGGLVCIETKSSKE